MASEINPATFDTQINQLMLGITTTPRPIPLVKDILKNPVTAVTKGSTYDNVSNLAPAFVDIIISKYEGTRLGRQELNAEILDDNPDALWQRKDIDDNRVHKIPDLIRVVVGVDPAATSKDGSDDTGIIVAGIDKNKHGYILGDYTCHLSPRQWAHEAISSFNKHNADRVVGETNNGGEMVEHTLRIRCVIGFREKGRVLTEWMHWCGL
ncbi:hypothetical protein V7O66_02105 [Methanolobus sp. ZRKC3]|uniref:phage terminase large subunit family protein n=1 Tax=Methanolobus sp. ZRKC3 TaxID=3125786 RepID=UPI003253B688